ncbi:filamentous hemagglutinin N-terminal domain-containing protein [Yersinia ruckeri]|uniref:two-partner secretion domain-containing protein n=1 Tax=Yersinia ruckeri TaxID=29486 RepID=UPI001F191736|nr:filamentous hemagglutinin N-terminal domain-containing protein [Yersinia ruckeri]UIN02543.1 filamentous hemagglutinin N-terminal domain-containing protein [Yersinia ruckeri]
MNRIYKLKFDKIRKTLIVVSELATGAGKNNTVGKIIHDGITSLRLGVLCPVSLLMGLSLGLLPGLSQATELPSGGHVVVGAGQITQDSNTLTVNQSGKKLGIDWNTFDVGRGHSVVFVQPDSSSVALNRVVGGGGASQIMGSLTANGQVFLLNPNGVLVGKSGQVSTGGFVASSQQISNADFVAGKITLTDQGGDGRIVNQGNLTSSKGGYVVLSGRQVVNEGHIATPEGMTALTSATQVSLALDNSGLTGITVNGDQINALVKNQGLIVADNGQVVLTARGQNMVLKEAVNNSGVIRAQGIRRDGGDIVLDGGSQGVVTQSGLLDAGSVSGRGGKVVVEGHNIHLTQRSETLAKGGQGGGTVRVGGGWQGKDQTVHNANAVVMDKGARIDVSAIRQGNGGTAVLWSDNYTQFDGEIAARGGQNQGDGGNVETSSHGNLQVFGAVNASSSQGKAGNWLLDPADVTITTSNAANTNTTANGTTTFTPTGSGSQISNTSINDQLNAGTSVTVLTNGTNVPGQLGSITLNADIAKTAGGNATLSLLADGNINLTNHNITSTNGALNVNLNAGRSNPSGSIMLNGANIRSNNGDIILRTNGVVPAGTAINISNSILNAGSGNISLTGNGGGIGIELKTASQLTGNNITINGTGNNQINSVGVRLSGVTLNATNTLHITSQAGRDGTSLDSSTGVNVLSGGNLVQIDSTAPGNWVPVIFNGATITSTLGDILINGTSGGNLTASGYNVLNALNTTFSAAGNVTLNTNQVGGTQGGVNLSGSNVSANNIIVNSVGNNRTGNIPAISISGNSRLNARNNITLTASGQSSSNSAISIITTEMNSNAGNISLTTDSGITLSGNNVMADKDINLNAIHGGVIIAGTNQTNGMANIISNKGNIRINGNATGSNNNGVSLRFVNLTAMNEIAVTGVGSSGVYGGGNFGGGAGAGIISQGVVSFNSAKNKLNGSNVNPSVLSGVSAVGLIFLSSDVTFTGDTTINALSDYGTGLMFNDGYGSSSSLKFLNGIAVINAESRNTGSADAHYAGGMSIYVWDGAPGTVNMFVSNATLNINASAQDVNGITSLNAFDIGENDNARNKGYRFYGNGNVNINASSQSGNGVELRILDNTDLMGNFNVSGQSQSGAGVIVSEYANVTVHNATITGTSQTGIGIRINASDKNTHQINLNNNILKGTSSTNTGINIIGNNVSITNGSLKGISDGRGTGVQITGGKNYTINGTTISGQSQAGSGVSVDGSLTVSNATMNGTTATGSGVSLIGDLISSNTSITGNASSSGNGVSLSGKVTGGVTDNNVITGNSALGDGLIVSGAPVVTNVTLNGNSKDGNGIKIIGDLNMNNTVVNGNATGSGNGINLAGNVIGGMMTGNSANGAGVNVSGDSIITNTSLNGTTTSGTGVRVSGSLMNAGSTTVNGRAIDSGTGDGVIISGKLSGGNISGSATRGNGITLANGGTSTNANLTGRSNEGGGVVINGNLSGGNLTGQSENGKGIDIASDGQVSDAKLTGNTANGSGVSLSGSLSGSDVNAEASGTGDGVTLNGHLTGGNISGSATRGNGFTLANGGTSTNANLTGRSNEGGGVVINGNLRGGNLTGRSENGKGIDIASNGQVSDAKLTGNTANGSGVSLSGSLSGSDVNAEASGTGDGVTLNGHLTGGNISGSATRGNGITLANGGTSTNANLTGRSNEGAVWLSTAI